MIVFYIICGVIYFLLATLGLHTIAYDYTGPPPVKSRGSFFGTCLWPIFLPLVGIVELYNKMMNL